MNQDPLDEIMLIAKALSEKHRLKVLYALQGKELCACDLMSYLGLAPSTVSRHMAVLKQAGLIQSRKSGKWVFFSIAHSLSPLARAMFDKAIEAFSSSPGTKGDRTAADKLTRGANCNGR